MRSEEGLPLQEGLEAGMAARIGPDLAFGRDELLIGFVTPEWHEVEVGWAWHDELGLTFLKRLPAKACCILSSIKMR